MAINRLKLLRAEQGLTQRQLAEKIGVKPSTVTGWESGKTKPTVSVLPRLAKQLNCTVADILVGGDIDAS